ncbi:T9SS type A sorting domain-containing protein [Ignavibacterium sp.]|uniref:T9SS type A sorting domain-containing protein n=1 Tax=Ignavibacterium sp. TaxID=2651167 RepID=UPI00307DB3D5
MKYLILVFGLVFCSYSYCQTQIPDLIIPINFTFQFAPPLNMQVGLDSAATDCLDLQIGESQLPPIPPPGWVAVINLPYPQCQGGFGEPIIVHKDFRFGELPFTGTKTHNFWFRQDLGVTIHWDLPNGVTGLLQDTFGGGGISVNMSGQDSFYVQYNFIDELNMILYYDNVIPVEFTSFTASVLQNEKAVQLDWITATETNNSGFEIERQVGSKQSAVGNREIIGFVPGFGTTTEPKSYSFIDENVSTGIYKYRLKQIDFDGSFEYSNEIEVEVDFTPKEFVLYQNYPNPFNPTTKIKYTIPDVGSGLALTLLKVYDILGNEVVTLVNDYKPAGSYEVEFNASNLSSGIYFYKLQAGSLVGTRKMILIK